MSRIGYGEPRSAGRAGGLGGAGEACTQGIPARRFQGRPTPTRPMPMPVISVGMNRSLAGETNGGLATTDVRSGSVPSKRILCDGIGWVRLGWGAKTPTWARPLHATPSRVLREQPLEYTANLGSARSAYCGRTCGATEPTPICAKKSSPPLPRTCPSYAEPLPLRPIDRSPDEPIASMCVARACAAAAPGVWRVIQSLRLLWPAGQNFGVVGHRSRVGTGQGGRAHDSGVGCAVRVVSRGSVAGDICARKRDTSTCDRMKWARMKWDAATGRISARTSCARWKQF